MNKSAIIIQGPHYGDYTRTVICEFLDRNENILIIVSTYIADKDKLDEWEKTLSSRVIYIFSEIPEDTEFHRTNYANQNQYFKDYRDTQNFVINLKYNFGNQKVKEAKATAKTNEQNRL